jgi:hypothetical protein
LAFIDPEWEKQHKSDRSNLYKSLFVLKQKEKEEEKYKDGPWRHTSGISARRQVEMGGLRFKASLVERVSKTLSEKTS